MNLKQKLLIGLLLFALYYSTVESTEVKCDERIDKLITRNGYLEKIDSRPDLIEANKQRNKSIFICFDLITELLALSSKENASLVTNKIQQEKRQLAKKKSRRKYANKYQKNLAEA